MIDIENLDTEVKAAETDPAADDEQQTDTGAAETPEQDGKLPKYLDDNAAAESAKDKEAGINDAEKEIETRIAAERAKWEKELQDKEYLKKLSPEEQSQRKIAELEAELRETKLKDAAVTKLSGDEYPVELADMLDYSSEESAERSYKKVTDTFKDALNAAMKARIKGKTPAGLGGAAKNENNIADIVAKNIRGGF